MSAEQIAATAAAGALAGLLCVRGDGQCTNPPCPGCTHDAARAGRTAVEAMSAAGLVILPAGRAAAMLEIAAAARALAESEEQMKAGLARRDVSHLYDPWPEADALVAALLAAEPSPHG